MTTPTTPGVSIQEVAATGPIAGVGTSTVAFVGPTLQEVDKRPIKITNWTEFKTNFGDYTRDAPPTADKRIYTPAAVQGFFSNGGTIAYIVPVAMGQDTGGQPSHPGQTQY